MVIFWAHLQNINLNRRTSSSLISIQNGIQSKKISERGDNFEKKRVHALEYFISVLQLTIPFNRNQCRM